jgi:hypothetical protein
MVIQKKKYAPYLSGTFIFYKIFYIDKYIYNGSMLVPVQVPTASCVS